MTEIGCVCVCVCVSWLVCYCNGLLKMGYVGDRARPGLYIEQRIWHVRIYGVYVYVLRTGCMIEQDRGFVMSHSVSNITPTT